MNKHKVGLGAALIVLVTLATPLPAFSAGTGVGPSTSGSLLMNVSLNSGKSTYTAFYSHPQWIETGHNMTVSVSFRIDSFTGYKTDVASFTITVSIPVTPQHQLSRAFNSNSSTGLIFLGNTFGPVSFTFAMTAAETGLAPGQEVNANVSLGFVWNVFYETPVNNVFPEYAQGSAGLVTIIDSANPGTPLIPIAIIIGGCVCLIGAAVLRRMEGIKEHPASEGKS